MVTNPTLYCPIRGQLTIKARSKNGLTFTEEKRRIDCIKYLLDKGYPKENFKIETVMIEFGHKGRNSFRTDIVIYKIPRIEADRLNLEDQREQMFLIAEIKRDNKDADVAKQMQVKPALSFLPDLSSVGVYWDDVEQRVFYRILKGTKQITKEASLAYLPNFQENVHVVRLRYNDLKVSTNLVVLFKKIEDTLHTYLTDKSARYELLLQLLLAKMYDENSCKPKNDFMIIQDFSLFENITDKEIQVIFNGLLEKSLNIYQKYLPKKVAREIKINGAALREIGKHISSIKLLESSPDVMQEFYMTFAKQLYKWDLAQYFTPYEVVDFIVKITNPQYGETVKDPACGSADFLISAYRQGLNQDPKIGDRLFGSDHSIQAVQISILNMVLNGDGKSNIIEEDSLENVDEYLDSFDVMLCNPPFGVRIVEKRPTILSKFELGKEVDTQQTGILFAELCVKQAKPEIGRIAIILPNGYLGNKSETYLQLRKWLLKNTKIVAIIGFPRFTFKKAGADVSASVLVMEKRSTPLINPQDSEEYPVYVNCLESVGWQIGNKKAEKIYKQNQNNGAFILDNETNTPILDADFQDVFQDMYTSPIVTAFPWVATGVDGANIEGGWSISIREIINHPYFTLDPKRLCRKYRETVEKIKSYDYSPLLDICEVVPYPCLCKDKSKIYKYVELNNVSESSYEFLEYRGWALPDRAKHNASSGDFFIAKVWGSVGKWFVTGSEADEGNLVVTNGCYRLKIRDGKEEYIPDLIFALSSEFFRIQMRALATGSDGLADISEEDLGLVLIPKLKDECMRAQLLEYYRNRIEEKSVIRTQIGKVLNATMSDLNIGERKTHFSQV